MNDLEALRGMFDRAGVRYGVDPKVENEFPTHPTTRHILETAGMLGPAHPRPGPANLGYFGFFTAFGFDADGTLLWVGAWE